MRRRWRTEPALWDGRTGAVFRLSGARHPTDQRHGRRQGGPSSLRSAAGVSGPPGQGARGPRWVATGDLGRSRCRSSRRALPRRSLGAQYHLRSRDVRRADLQLHHRRPRAHTHVDRHATRVRNPGVGDDGESVCLQAILHRSRVFRSAAEDHDRILIVWHEDAVVAEPPTQPLPEPRTHTRGHADTLSRGLLGCPSRAVRGRLVVRSVRPGQARDTCRRGAPCRTRRAQCSSALVGTFDRHVGHPTTVSVRQRPSEARVAEPAGSAAY